MDLAEQIAGGIIATNAVLARIAPTKGAPDVAGGVRAHPVGDAGLGHFREDLAVRCLAAFHIDVEDANMRRIVGPVGEPCVDDVELLLVREKVIPFGSTKSSTTTLMSPDFGSTR
jgi:hypothetical protein